MTKRNFALRSVAAVGAVLVAAHAASAYVAFSTGADINVLRQYSPTGQFLVPHTTVGVGVSISRDADAPQFSNPNDGGQWNTETDSSFNSGDTVTQTFTLGGTYTVGSFKAEWDGGGRAPATYKMQGSLDGVSYTDFLVAGNANITPAGSDLNLTFDNPQSVKFIRAIATGPANSGTTFGIDELQVFQTPGAVAENAGFNFLHDRKVSGAVTTATSPNTGIWAAPNGGSADTEVDGFMNTAELKAQVAGANGGDRAYILYTLSTKELIQFANLGNSKGQDWNHFEMYTSNDAASIAALTTIGDNNLADLTGAGWTLQHQITTQNVGGQPAHFFALNNPGKWKNVLVVWDVQFGGSRELELIATPEPASAGLLLLGGLAMVRRRRA